MNNRGGPDVTKETEHARRGYQERGYPLWMYDSEEEYHAQFAAEPEPRFISVGAMILAGLALAIVGLVLGSAVLQSWWGAIGLALIGGVAGVVSIACLSMIGEDEG